ncbi:MAG TPA: transposase [Patescibacteria group bacterium]|nr:transposase [Patescibacteria group bacterium]
MNIIQETFSFLQSRILPEISGKHKRLFSFGIHALSLHPFVSLNGNARMVVPNRSTAESKIFRLVSNETIATYFPTLINHLHLVDSDDIVNVDFSSFCGFEVLTFAKQTRLGRAIPLYFELLRYPIVDPGSQTLCIISAITRFKKMLGFCPTLVFDRGFELPRLVEALLNATIRFYIRMRKDKHILYQGNDIPLRNLPWYEKDATVTIYGKRLRVVVSEKLSERTDSQGKEESWYILTNDTTFSKEQIIASYYFRFEIEETFKDLKHINRLKTFFPIKKKLTFTILLWFSILTIWIAFLLEGIQQYLFLRITQKKRKKLAVTRFFFESIQQAKNILVQEVFAM